MLNRTVVRKDRTELILCACGCGKQILRYHPVEGYERKFISGHNTSLDKINRNWRGGHIVNGYCRIGRKTLHHRFVYEQYHKCCLLPWIDIHHIDGNKLNNNIDNLQPLPHKIHMYITKINNDIFNRKCSLCGSGTRINKSGRPVWGKARNGIYWCMKCYIRDYRKKLKYLISHHVKSEGIDKV